MKAKQKPERRVVFPAILFSWNALVFNIELIHSNEQGNQRQRIGENAGDRTHGHIVDDPKNAGGQGDDPQQLLVFHTVGNSCQKLRGNGQQACKAVVSEHACGNYKTAEHKDDRQGGDVFLHQLAEQKISNHGDKIQHSRCPRAQ